MLMNSYIAAAVLAFCAAQTGAVPVAVPPPELLAEKNIPFPGFDASKWTPSFSTDKRDAEAQWNTANKDGSVPDSFMQAVNKWQKAKSSSSSSSSKSSSNNGKRDASFAANPDGTLPQKSQDALDRWNALYGFPGEKRDAMTVAPGPDGSLSKETQEALDRWEAQFGYPAKNKRDALSVIANPDGSLPKESQDALDRWNALYGFPGEKRDAVPAANPDALFSDLAQDALDPWQGQLDFGSKNKRSAKQKQNIAQGPGILDLNNGEYRPLMIQRREAEPQVFSGLPSASWFKNYQAARSKKNNGNGKREAGSSSTKNNYISIPASAWAAALKKQGSGKSEE